MSDDFAMRGVIAGCGFASGDRFVIGHWSESPVGAFSDVMWAAPDGHRTLLVADAAASAFVTSVYEFDTVEVRALEVVHDRKVLAVRAGELAIVMRLGTRIPVPRPPWLPLVRAVGPISRLLTGAGTYGVSPTGVREWYRASALQRVQDAHARRGNVDLGAFGPPRPACGFGFTDAPRFAALTELRPQLRFPGTR
jgi:hypothetical protein